jgi:hypothetical protein
MEGQSTDGTPVSARDQIPIEIARKARVVS